MPTEFTRDATRSVDRPSRRGLGMPLRFRRRVSRPRRRRKPPPGTIPSALTVANGLCGAVSIAIATNSLFELERHRALFFSAALVFVGMLFDMLDGRVARKLNQMSTFGTQLDSLSDAVSFGTAPIFVLLLFNDFYPAGVLLTIGLVHLTCVLLRLARFNVQTDDADTHEFFTGLPSPAAAGIIVSFAIGLSGLHRWHEFAAGESIEYLAQRLQILIMLVAPILSLFVSWLMVSKVSYRHVANQWRGRKVRRSYQLSRAAVIIGATIVLQELALAVAFCIFAFEPPIKAWIKGFRKQQLPDDPVRLAGRVIEDESSAGKTA